MLYLQVQYAHFLCPNTKKQVCQKVYLLIHSGLTVSIKKSLIVLNKFTFVTSIWEVHPIIINFNYTLCNSFIPKHRLLFSTFNCNCYTLVVFSCSPLVIVLQPMHDINWHYHNGKYNRHKKQTYYDNPQPTRLS